MTPAHITFALQMFAAFGGIVALVVTVDCLLDLLDIFA